MREPSLCVRPLEGGGARLEAHDPRFQHVVELAQAGQYTPAADAVEVLFAEDLFEVRLVGYYLYACFHEEGLVQLPDITRTLSALIQRNRDLLGSGDKRAILLNKSMAWLFQTVLDTLGYHQSLKDERWQDWWTASTEAGVAKTLQAVRELLEVLSAPVFRAGAEALAKLLPWLQDLRAQLLANLPQDPPPPAEAKPAAAPPPAVPEPPSSFLKLGQPVQLVGSAHLVELCNKLKAFELLVAREDFQKAALVSDDILATLERFDPRRYFPDLFSSFGALLNKHVRHIRTHWEDKDSAEWKTLAQFYQVDLERFVKPE